MADSPKRPRKGFRDSPEWQKQTFKLPADLDLGPLAKPGYNVFIADRGAVGFCYPKDWIVRPGKSSIEFRDREPPDDDCLLQVSVHRLPPIKGGRGQLPLERLVREIRGRDRRGSTPVGEVVVEKRPELELAWSEVRFIDPKEKRPARSRCCLARANLVQPLITMDFWERDLAKFGPVWDEVLATLRVGLELPGPPPVGFN